MRKFLVAALLLGLLLFPVTLAVGGEAGEPPITPDEVMAAVPIIVLENATVAITHTKLGYVTLVIVHGPQARVFAKRYGGNLIVLEDAHLIVYFDTSMEI